MSFPGTVVDPAGLQQQTASDKFDYTTITGNLKHFWASTPQKEAIIFYDDHDQRTAYTFAQVEELSGKCSNLLRVQGVHKGDIVCNTLANSVEREIVNWGIILCGAVVMDGGCIRDHGQKFWVPFQQAKVNHIIVDPTDPESIAWQMLRDDVGHSYADFEKASIYDIPSIKKIFKFRLKHYMDPHSSEKSAFDHIRAQSVTFVEHVANFDNAVLFVSRSFSQMYYKLVMRNHSKVCHIALRIRDMFKLGSDDILYNDWPLSWLPGITLSHIVTGCTYVKSTLFLCPEYKIVQETWNLIEGEKCTIASLQQNMIPMLSSHCEDLPQNHWTLRVLSVSGLVKSAITDAIGPLTKTIVHCYSLIEAGVVSRAVVTEKNKVGFPDACVGDLSGSGKTRFDSEGPNSAKPTKVGEILLRGKLVTSEYYKNPALSRSLFTQDGFLMTGDLGFYDENGRLFVLGRKSEAIIRGDTPIFPEDLEEKVNQCPGIWKVKIVSIKDEKGIVQMCACVVPRSQDSLTIDRVKEFCRYQLGGTHDDDDNPHMPTYVFFFEEFPMWNGKVNRRALAFTAASIVQGQATFDNQ